MKKKLICLTALLILSCMMLSSCITQMFGDMGITQPPETTHRPGIGADSTTPETDSANNTPAYGSKPSYAGIKLSDHIKVDYKNIKVEVDSLPPEVTEQVMNGELTALIDYYVTNYGFKCDSETVKEGTVEEWDLVEISFVGKIDGVAFESGTSNTNAWMIVNDNSSGYIPGFASGVIGAKVGEMVEVPVTFPTNYNEALAGKDAIFEITVYSKKTYTVTDAVVSELTGGDYKTVADFMAYYKDYLTNLYESNLLDQVSDALVAALSEKSTVYSYPNEQFLYYYNSNVAYMTSQAEKLGMSYEDYMTSVGETDDILREKAQNAVRDDMAIYYVLEAEGKTYTDEDYQKALEYYVNYYNSQGYNYDKASIEQLFEYYYYPGYLRYQLNLEKAIQILFENAEIVEKK